MNSKNLLIFSNSIFSLVLVGCIFTGLFQGTYLLDFIVFCVFYFSYNTLDLLYLRSRFYKFSQLNNLLLILSSIAGLIIAVFLTDYLITYNYSRIDGSFLGDPGARRQDIWLRERLLIGTISAIFFSVVGVLAYFNYRKLRVC